MRNIKTFESFANESIVNEAKYKHMDELIQLLSDIDAMEMMPAEFEDHLSTELDIDGKKAMDIFDAYWSLGAKDRFHFTEKDWKKFLNKQGIK